MNNRNEMSPVVKFLLSKLTILSVFIVSGCGQAAPDSFTMEQVSSLIPPVIQPLLLYGDFSVNKASAGLRSGMLDLHLLTTLANAPGAFNGGGKGNKAILGIHNFDGQLLSSLNVIESTFRTTASGLPASVLYLNLLIDLNCDGSVIKILTSDIQLRAPAAPDADGFQTYRLNLSTDSDWRAVGGITLNTEVIVPLNSGSITSNLSRLNQVYPSACLVAVNSHDGGMPKAVITPSILFVVGSSGSLFDREAFIKEVKLNDVSLSFLQ